MFGLNEGLNQSTGMEFPIRMFLGILELVCVESSFRKALLCIAWLRCVTRAESKKECYSSILKD